jgi:hypothetical protein
MGRIPDQAHAALSHLVSRPVRQRDRRRPLGASKHLPSATQDTPHLIVCVLTRVNQTLSGGVHCYLVEAAVGKVPGSLEVFLDLIKQLGGPCSRGWPRRPDVSVNET